MLLYSFTTKTPLCKPSSNNPILCPNNKHQSSSGNVFTQRSSILANASSSLANAASEEYRSLHSPTPSATSGILHHVSQTGLDEEEEKQDEGGLVPSASAIASAIRKVSTSPVEFMQRTVKKDGKTGLVLPSQDFQRLCLEQLDLFRRIVDPDAVLSVYVRPAGSYIMDRLELRRVTFYPAGVDAEDIVIAIGNFSVPAGLRAAEAVLSNQQTEIVPEYRAMVFPMAKHPFVVGFLVAELPTTELETCDESQRVEQESPCCSYPEESSALPPCSDDKASEVKSPQKKDQMKIYHKVTVEQRLNAINISRSLAMAYVMDQKSMLLQQSSWQNNVRMSNLIEQIRGPLSSIRTLSKMLSVHTKRSEISYDIIEDISVQGDRMRETLQQLQDAVCLTKANIVRYNEEKLKKMHNSTYIHPDSVESRLWNNFSGEAHSDKTKKSGAPLPLSSAVKDSEMPMPPLALVAVQQKGIRPCNVSDILTDLVGAVGPLAHKQQRVVELTKPSQSLQVAVEESAMRQALSNLIEGALLRTHVGGKVEIVSTGAPAGGALVVIDDDGPDMHYMTQLRSLSPFGADLLSEEMVEDNMTWNFVAGLTVAREILESHGCFVRVISPRAPDAALGTGGTRVELWLPSLQDSSDQTGHSQDA